MSQNNNISPLYDKKHIARFKTVERLDKALPLITPMLWLGIVAVFLLIASIFLWSVFGSFTNRVSGIGLIIVNKNDVSDDLDGVLFVPATQGKMIEPDMEVNVNVSGFDVYRAGRLVGKVTEVSDYPVSIAEMTAEIKNEDMAKSIASELGGSLMQVDFEPVKADTPSNYLWTMNPGAKKALTAGSVCRGFIIVDRQSPMEWMLDEINHWWDG